MQEEKKSRIHLTGDERLWFDRMGVIGLMNIYTLLLKEPDIYPTPSGSLHCYSIAQMLTLDAAGMLMYHEGKAFDRIEHKFKRHAWNSIHGEIIDWNLPPALYRDYQTENTFTFEEVKAQAKRAGFYDWLNNPTLTDAEAEQLRRSQSPADPGASSAEG